MSRFAYGSSRYQQSARNAPSPTAPATDAQKAFIHKLVQARTSDPYPSLDGCTKSQASKIIEALLKVPVPVTTTTQAQFDRDLSVGGLEYAEHNLPAPARVPATDEGMYRSADGSIFKVQESGTGRLYAKLLTQIGGERITQDGNIGNWEFVYDRGAIHSLSATDRLTLKEAQAFGIKYGICCRCAAPLSDAKSVAAGIGPVCATKL